MYYPFHWYKGPDKSIDPLQEGRQKQVVGLIYRRQCPIAAPDGAAMGGDEIKAIKAAQKPAS